LYIYFLIFKFKERDNSLTHHLLFNIKTLKWISLVPFATITTTIKIRYLGFFNVGTLFARIV